MHNYILTLLMIRIVKYNMQCNMQYTASDYPFDIFKLFFKMKEPGTLRESQRSNASL